MSSFGIFCFKIGDDCGFWFQGPEGFIQVEYSQPPVGKKISVQFFKDSDQGSDYLNMKRVMKW